MESAGLPSGSPTLDVAGSGELADGLNSQEFEGDQELSSLQVNAELLAEVFHRRVDAKGVLGVLLVIWKSVSNS